MDKQTYEQLDRIEEKQNIILEFIEELIGENTDETDEGGEEIEEENGTKL